VRKKLGRRLLFGKKHKRLLPARKRGFLTTRSEEDK
jgi:hypothetical protein